ncbi:MAG TPA: prepilin peptidase [Candidatus Paceibacterota bacterium]|nr:prepilin peptidase [Candidatus Paceibacterota bacterium]
MELGVLLSFVFGTIIGSFLNVVAARYNTGLSINGRSMCMTCGRKLRAMELVPVLSYAALRGRCRTCGSAISIQYPLVEFVTGVLFAGVYAVTIGASATVGPVAIISAAFAAAVWSILTVITVYDIKHKIIPDSLVFIFIGLSFLHMLVHYGSLLWGEPYLVSALLAGPIVAAPFLVLWLVSRGTWIGLGDAKLALGIGWFLGLSGAISAILLGFWSGAFLSVCLLLMNKLPERRWLKRLGVRHRALSGKTEIPFAPFLILGIAIVYFFHLSVIAF